ncbi:hypothetical protein ACQKNX_23715 [Lysinibacillus sp. NPDC093712]|uniref:hypothetical protein n=1 Tax=Lysinibacillus sp. NPDC093712 TaxID=3390579 RepID=UPI003D05D820
MNYFSLLAILFIVLIAGAIYEMKKNNDIKLEQIKLEREKVALEQKRLEIENKTEQ